MNQEIINQLRTGDVVVVKGGTLIRQVYEVTKVKGQLVNFRLRNFKGERSNSFSARHPSDIQEIYRPTSIEALTDLQAGDWVVATRDGEVISSNWLNTKYRFSYVFEGKLYCKNEYGIETLGYEPELFFRLISLDPSVKPVKVEPMNTTPATPSASRPAIPAIISANGTISAVIDNKAYTLAKDSFYYEAAKACLRAKDAEGFVRQCDLDKTLRTRSSNQIRYENGKILWGDAQLPQAIVSRVETLLAEDFSFEPLLKFLNLTLENPRPDAVKELYLFLEANSLPITEDGHFLAYRRVNNDYTSKHANPDGTRNSNKIGEVVEMPREQVDANRWQTCSTGLHFCSISYLSSYGGERTMIVKISPKDVVAIPSDYNNQKGRCCRYEVVGELQDGSEKTPVDVLTEMPVYQATSEFGVKPSGQKYHNARGENGRFVKR